ncbi:MAG: hypothetical protein U0X20_15060 [Caldilineaceae bacterium]
MASSEERMMILRMVEEGKITPEEGARLLSAMGEREAAAEPVGAAESAGAAAGASDSYGSTQGWSGTAYGSPAYGSDFGQVNTAGNLGGRVFHVRVTNGVTGKPKVDVNIPLSLVDFGLRFIPPNSKVDAQKIREAIASGTRGRIVDVMDNEKGDHVEIFFE